MYKKFKQLPTKEAEMVKFIDVDPDEIPNIREAHRGRVSYPILKSFLETNKSVVMLDRTGVQQSLQSLTSSLNAYIRSHSLPIKMFTRRGQIYLARTDILDGGEVPTIDMNNFSRRTHRDDIGVAPKDLLEDESIPSAFEEVDSRFLQEKGQTTK